MPWLWAFAEDSKKSTEIAVNTSSAVLGLGIILTSLHLRFACVFIIHRPSGFLAPAALASFRAAVVGNGVESADPPDEIYFYFILLIGLIVFVIFNYLF